MIEQHNTWNNMETCTIVVLLAQVCNNIAREDNTDNTNNKVHKDNKEKKQVHSTSKMIGEHQTQYPEWVNFEEGKIQIKQTLTILTC